MSEPRGEVKGLGPRGIDEGTKGIDEGTKGKG